MSNDIDQSGTDDMETLLRRIRQPRPLTSKDRACVDSALREAIAIAGSKRELARRLCVTPRCIYHWIEYGWIPAEQAVCLELVTGIARQRFAPRIFRPVAELVARGTERDATGAVRHGPRVIVSNDSGRLN
jgi:hypothetical protein